MREGRGCGERTITAATTAAAAKLRIRQEAERARARNPNALIINLKDSKNAASIVREVAYGLGWREAACVAEECQANVFWYERAISVAEVKLLNERQRVNMIPGMHDIARKGPLARALNRMRQLFPEEYDFYPMTWLLPSQYDAFRSYTDECRRKDATYIVKPSGGSQGSGIYLTRSVETLSSHSNAIVQEYVDSPLILDGLKFDLRLYVLVLSVQPLTAYLFKQGMARFATNKYRRPTDANLGDVFMHLTNYSLNKRNTAYVKAHGRPSSAADDEGSGEESDDGSDGADEPLEDEPPSAGGGHARLPPVTAPSSRGIPLEGLARASSSSAAKREGDDGSMRPEAWREEDDGAEDDGEDEEGCEDVADADGTNASKRSVEETFDELVRRGILSASDVSQIWSDIEEVVAKTLVATSPAVAATYSACFPGDDAAAPQTKCFQIVGFDLLLDSQLKPWLIEINHNPSFTCDTDFDRELKGSVVRAALGLLDLQPFDKTQYKEQYERAMAVKELKHASTPLERERLQQQRLKERRMAAVKALTSGRRASASEDAAAAGPPSAAPPAAAPAARSPPRSYGGFERISIQGGAMAHAGASSEHARYQLFAAPSLHRAWRHCVGVRGRKVSAVRFQSMIRDAGLLDARLSAADVDLLFKHTVVRHGNGHYSDLDASGGMGFHDFCDALVEVARRKHVSTPEQPELNASALERVLAALPAAAGPLRRESRSPK